MTVSGLEGIDHSAQLAHRWVNELDEMFGWRDRALTFRMLRAVLQTVRDWLPVNEAADFAAQLPSALRGVFYERWQPGQTPVKHRDSASFVAHVDHIVADRSIKTTPAFVEVVFELLSRKISPGEIEDVRRSLPEDVRKLWRGPISNAEPT